VFDATQRAVAKTKVQTAKQNHEIDSQRHDAMIQYKVDCKTSNKMANRSRFHSSSGFRRAWKHSAWKMWPHFRRIQGDCSRADHDNNKKALASTSKKHQHFDKRMTVIQRKRTLSEADGAIVIRHAGRRLDFMVFVPRAVRLHARQAPVRTSGRQRGDALAQTRVAAGQRQIARGTGTRHAVSVKADLKNDHAERQTDHLVMNVFSEY
jgi:hypothetical protein